MSNALLNAEKLNELLDKKGLKRNWVIQQLGMKSTAGHMLLRNGLLPKDEGLRTIVIEKLSEILGEDATKLFLRVGARKSA